MTDSLAMLDPSDSLATLDPSVRRCGVKMKN
jgi:hypothetical protein